MSFDFDMNLYKVFYVVAKNNSFSKAAEELFVTQPSVSYSIKQLEGRLNIKLFKRNHKGIKITPEGVQSHIGRFFLFPYIEEFHKKYPNIEINISSRNTAELIKLLENNDIDFVIDTSPIETEYSNLVIEPLMELEHCFVSSRNYAIKNKNINIEDLNEYSLILPVKRSTPRKQLTNLLRDDDIELKPFITIETTEMLIDAVKKNMGIGYVMRNAIEEELKSNELEEIKVNIQLPKLLLNLVYIESNLTNIPKVFMEELKINNVKIV